MAYYTEGPEIADRITEAIRREAEGCSNLQGIQLTYDLSTSAEGGLGSLTLDRLRE
ncbi:hypothetical protein BJY01DRAFT_213095 [Aspergillus pseudoustus]|uniref:Thiamine-binding protein domain-containing protein n=1 Tax=Aspergillus pseudoustus TaxID=1810923 RepID=A0ABR4K3Q9_9EURO